MGKELTDVFGGKLESPSCKKLEFIPSIPTETESASEKNSYLTCHRFLKAIQRYFYNLKEKYFSKQQKQ